MWAILSCPEQRGGWDHEQFFASGRDDVDQLMAEIGAVGLSLSGTRALDFGCGLGRLTHALADHFDQVIGVDISPKMIARARSLNSPSGVCEYRINDTGDLRWCPDASCDLVVSLLTLQHMRPRYALGYLAEFLRVLRPGAVLAVQLPSHQQPAATRARSAYRALAPQPLRNRVRRIAAGRLRAPEMYCLPADAVVSHLARHEGKLLARVEDLRTPGWIGYRYLAQKRPA
jgi:trans-aconitate methyltransferase